MSLQRSQILISILTFMHHSGAFQHNLYSYLLQPVNYLEKAAKSYRANTASIVKRFHFK